MRKKRIKIFCVGCVFLLVGLCFSTVCFAQDSGETPYSEEIEQNITEQLAALGVDDLIDRTPEETRDLMAESGFGDLSVGTILSMSPQNFLNSVVQLLKNMVKAPLAVLSTVAGIILLCTLLGQIKDGSRFQSGSVFSLVSALCIMLTLVAPIIGCVKKVSESIQGCSNFMVSFVPIFSATVTVSGQPVTASTYQIFLFAASQFISYISLSVLLPMLKIYLAFSLTTSLVPELNISTLISSIKSCVCWSLGLLLTFYVGLLSIQSIVSTGADNLTMKTTKFLVGSFVPVIGGALSEAINTTQGCLKLIKTTVGSYGILVVVFTFLPILLQTLLWYAVSSAAAIVSEIFGNSTITGLVKACSSTLGILLAVILCFALLLIVTTTIIMVMGLGL